MKRILLSLAACLLPIALLALVFIHWRHSRGVVLSFWSAAFSRDGQTLLTTSGQDALADPPRLGELAAWELAKGKKHRLVWQPCGIRAVVQSSDGKFVALGDFSGATKLVHPVTGKLLAVLPPHSTLVSAVAISADNTLIASGSMDGTVSFGDTAGKELGMLVLPGEKVLNVAVSPNGRLLVATTLRGSAYLYDLVRNDEPQALLAYEGPPMESPEAKGAAFAPDGLSLATGCQRTVRLWDSLSSRMIRQLEGATCPVNSVAFSPDGTTLAAVDSEGTLRLWGTALGEQINEAPAHRGSSSCVVFTPDGRRLATVGRDDLTVKLWDAQTLALVRTLNARAR
jgi:WD40 repeat protein